MAANEPNLWRKLTDAETCKESCVATVTAPDYNIDDKYDEAPGGNVELANVDRYWDINRIAVFTESNWN
jgi:hypothetical protein